MSEKKPPRIKKPNMKDKTMSEREVKIARAYQKVFSTKDGELVLFDILEQGYFLRTPPTADGHQLALVQGRREAAMAILSQTKINISKLRELIDNQEKEKEDFYD